MSRAFVNEDAEQPPIRYTLPGWRDPGYDAAAALAMIEGARHGDTAGAEEATGYRWGEPRLRPHMERLIEQQEELPETERDQRLITLARRYLRSPGPA